jgi:Zn finger protein HypA/HybF involved in hydrogenase expression
MADFKEATKTINAELACISCGAILKFKPGTHHLVCDYCGAQNEIADPAESGNIQEINLEEFLERNFNLEDKIEVATVKCNSCGATTTLAPTISSDKCPFCAATLVVQTGSTASVHKPHCVLPFGLDEKKALENFRQWLNSLWFAPSELKHYGDRANKLSGMYLPFWTFDCSTTSNYTGQRGEDYYTTESYTAVENGKNVTRTRQVKRTRWYPAAGVVSNSFDDILIEATRSLPKNKLRALEPWDLKNLVSYNDKYLSGFRTETYTVELKNGYHEAQQRMEPEIHHTICNYIGGDQQRINHVSTTYHNPTFKHILLPVYLSAYRYKNTVYQFLVNARTGEVQGQRPYSAGKIALAILAGIIVILLIIFFAGGK